MNPRLAAIARFCRCVPLAVRRSLLTGLAAGIYPLAPRQRLIALHNLQCAFPEKSQRDRIRIAKASYRHMAAVVATFFELPRIDRAWIRQKVRIQGWEASQRALQKNRGLLLFGAHFGHWELGWAALAVLIQPLMIIYRPFDSPFLEPFVTGIRSQAGILSQPKDHAMRPMLRRIRDKGIVALLIDQNVAWQEGVFVDFFGRTACTTNGLALLARHTEAPVLPFFMVGEKGGRYRLVLGEEVSLVCTGDRESDVRANTQRFTAIIEEMVRRHPEQWLWVHHRWKTKTCQVPPRPGHSLQEAGSP